MKNTVFRGIATAMITPFTPDGSAVNFEQYGRLIDRQLDAGINALVIAATTGEGPTLTDREHKDVISFAVDRVAGRVPVIAGTGSNDTAYGIQLTKYACDAGVDACLVVTPYYNKATQDGLIRMYTEYADASTKPIIIYNVPSRTGVNVAPDTYAALSKHPNIAATKEANGDIGKIVELAAKAGDNLDIYSGNDDQIVPILSMGGIGCVSTMANVIPEMSVAITDKWFSGDIEGACALQKKVLPLIRGLFCEVNPIPVKAACARLGLCDNVLRSPMYPMQPDTYEKLAAAMDELGVEA